MVQSALVINWRCQRRKTVPQERLPNLRSLCPAELGPDACLCGEMTETGLTLCGVASYLTVASTGDWICRFLSYQSLGGGGLVTQEIKSCRVSVFLASPGGPQRSIHLLWRRRRGAKARVETRLARVTRVADRREWNLAISIRT